MAKDNHVGKTHGSPEPLADFSARRLRLIAHYIDPTSAGYGNKRKSAELADFGGTRASQKSEGCRTIKLARKDPGLANLLIDTGCTLDRALERVSACLDAKIRRPFMTKEGKVLVVEIGDNSALQLQASKVIIDLNDRWNGVTQQEPMPASACTDLVEPAELVSDKSMDTVNENGPSDRTSPQGVPEGNYVVDDSTARQHTEKPIFSGTTGVTLPRFASTNLLQELEEAKNITSQINPATIVTLALLDTYREYEHAHAQQRKGCSVDMSKIRRDFCMIAGTLSKLGSAGAADANSGQITVPDDLTPEEQELQRKAKTLDPRSRMLMRDVIAAEEEVIIAKVRLAEMEDVAASEQTENRPEEDEPS